MTRTWYARRSLAAVALTASLSLPLALSACGGTPEAGSAAVVGDRRISVSDVQNATADISAFYSPQPVAQQQVLFFLIAGPAIAAQAAANGVGYSTDDALQEMRTKLADPTPAGVEVYRANQAISKITQLGGTDQAKAQAIIDAIRVDLQRLKVTVNPRYGTFDSAELQIAEDTQNWIVATATPSPSAAVEPGASEPAPSEPAPSEPAAQPSPSAS